MFREVLDQSHFVRNAVFLQFLTDQGNFVATEEQATNCNLSLVLPQSPPNVSRTTVVPLHPGDVAEQAAEGIVETITNLVFACTTGSSRPLDTR